MPYDTDPNGEPNNTLEEDLIRRADADGTLMPLLAAFRALTGSKVGRGLVRMLGQDPDQIVQLVTQHERLVEITAGAVRMFASHGWAPTAKMPMDLYGNALQILERTQSIAEADKVLVEGWQGSFFMSSGWRRIFHFGSEDPAYNSLFRARGRLIEKAVGHHCNGAYEAAIPIVLAQIEGITADATGGKLFFSKKDGRKAEVVDDHTIAGLEQGLPVVRAWFSQDESMTTTGDSPSRHGILHGRVLGYDTKANSTKALVLLASVMEWAEPRVEEEGRGRREERETRNAGSLQVDERGRRVDDREFHATQAALQWLAACQLGWYQNLAAYRDDLLDMIGDFESQGLPKNHGITLRVSADRQSWWAWRTTPSGQVLGIGADGSPLNQWLYDAEVPPSSGPTPGCGWGEGPFSLPPNWQ